MNLTTPPPAKLSDLLELAIADARRLDHALYTPMWMTWHRPRPLDGKCMVCIAGAVIAGTLGCPAGTSIDIATSDSTDPQSTTITDERWRRALNTLPPIGATIHVHVFRHYQLRPRITTRQWTIDVYVDTAGQTLH